MVSHLPSKSKGRNIALAYPYLDTGHFILACLVPYGNSPGSERSALELLTSHWIQPQLPESAQKGNWPGDTSSLYVENRGYHKILLPGIQYNLPPRRETRGKKTGSVGGWERKETLKDIASHFDFATAFRKIVGMPPVLSASALAR
jgi:hypothetical protein